MSPKGHIHRRRWRAVALLLGGGCLALALGIPGDPDSQGFAPSADAQPLRKLIARLRGQKLPDGIVKAHGRTEATQVDVSSKYSGQLAEFSVQEGDRVRKGEVVGGVSSPEIEAQLRAAQSGETVAAGEPIVTIVDLTDLYMVVFLGAAEAGKLGIGDDARVILDAAPDYVIPAKVSFVASASQFTPKSVETEDERAKLMFRIQLRIDPQELERRYGKVEPGLNGSGGKALAFRQPVDQFAQAAIVESQRIRLPSATCQLESASREGDALKLSAECADSISYTSRIAYVQLRSKCGTSLPSDRRSGAGRQSREAPSVTETAETEPARKRGV